MKDVILKGAFWWTIVPQNCDRVLIDHVRLAGSRVGNDDGVDPCNSSNITVRNCFFVQMMMQFLLKESLAKEEKNFQNL